MADCVWIPIHRSIYNQFILRSRKDVDVPAWIEDIIQNYLDATEADPQIWSVEHRDEVLTREALDKVREIGDPKLGVHWQHVFLPNGTTLKMRYQGKDHFAYVRHQKIIFGRTECSPSEFASKVANNTSRNAWRDIWVMRPGDKVWVFADDERRRSQ